MPVCSSCPWWLLVSEPYTTDSLKGHQIATTNADLVAEIKMSGFSCYTCYTLVEGLRKDFLFARVRMSII